MKKWLILALSLSFMACASKEESPLRSDGRAAAQNPPSALERASQDLHQSAKFARLSKAIRFDYGSTTLNADSKLILDQLATEMNQSANSFQKIRIAGFTDAQGNPSRSREVSLQRAESVRSYLIARGVPSEKLEAVGMGSTYANQNRKLSKAQTAGDRRVELEIVE